MQRAPAAPLVVGVQIAAGVLVATAVADALGHAAPAFYLLFFGIPILSICGLVAFGRAVDGANRGDGEPFARLLGTLSALVVAALVLGAAARAPALTADAVPPVATFLLALAFLLVALQALVAVASARRLELEAARGEEDGFRERGVRLDRVAEDLDGHLRSHGERELAEPLSGLGADGERADEHAALAIRE